MLAIDLKSMSKKFFIHIPKCAGMTIRRSSVLSSKIICAEPNTHKSKEYTKSVKKKMDSHGDHHGFEHARWRDINPSLQKQYDFFAVARNPWDRVVSRYFFAKKVIEVEKTQSTSYADVSSFEAFLEERHKWGNEPYMWHRAVRGWYPAVDHVCDEEGNLKCDMIRFDKLNEDLCAYFGIKEMTRARNVTGLNKKRYMDMYNPTTLQIVADWYADDIDMWGYDFDTGAKKNYWRYEC